MWTWARGFRRRVLAFWLACALAAGAYAQVETPDSLAVTYPSGVTARADTLAPAGPRAYALSPDAITDAVTYTMRDSMHYRIPDKLIRMYGEAEVAYTDLTLGAGVLSIDYGNSILEAFPVSDSTGALTERPSFEQGAQAFEAKGIRYNFRTRKGIITNATTQQGDLYVLGGRTKLVAAMPGDDARRDNTVYNESAIITSCDLEHPHYGIRSNKQKVVPGKQVIVGPSNVELGGVPTPLWLPFGFFPIGSSERSGLIFPKDYTYDPIAGFGFRQIGWYFPWNEYVHSSVTTDIFLRGTVRLSTSTDYNRRYRYNGNIGFTLARDRTEVEGATAFTPRFAFVWRHAQDAKAHPYRTLRADVNIQTRGLAQAVGFSPESQLTNIFRSNVSASFRFPRHPAWNLSVAASHSQNTQTKIVTVNAPQARFSTGAMYPFENAPGASTAWYKKAVVTYTANAGGTVEATDSTLFEAEPWRDALLGGQHSASFSAPVNVLKYFRLSPNLSVNQTLFADEFSRVYVPDLRTDSFPILSGVDTIGYNTQVVDNGRAVDSLTRGFAAATSLNASLSLQTNIYGTARFKLGGLRGVRHILTPTLSVGYTPDYSRPPFNYYDEVQVNAAGLTEEYLRFARRPFSPGSLPNDESFRLNYSIGNRVETKIQSRKDTTTRLVTLLNNLTVSGNYDFSADSLAWSNVTVSGAQFTFFKNLVRVNVGSGRFGVYQRSADGRRDVDTTLLSMGKFPLRFDAIQLQLSAQLTMAQLRGLIAGEDVKTTGNEVFSLIDRFRISYNYARRYNRFSFGPDGPWTTSANSVNLSGAIPITPKWSISNLNLGYDLRSRRIAYPFLTLRRDLHCWEMDFSWAPAIGTFNFGIRVKPGSLGFLEVPYRRGNRY